MLAALGAMGGGGLSTQSSSSAEATASSGNIGAVKFGDKVAGGLKISPVTIGLVIGGLLLGLWLWKKK